MKVSYTETALAEIDDIYSFIKRDNPTAAAAVTTAIERTVVRVAKRPNSGRLFMKERCGPSWWNDINTEFSMRS